MSDPDAVLALEPEDLDGHTVDELVDYLERGREPADPSIDTSPACQIALSALQRLREAAHSFLDVSPEPGDDQRWIGAVLAAIPVDARAGRRFPLPPPAAGVSADVTEGALRGLVRAVGDGVPGLLVGSVRLGEAVDGPASLRVQVAVVLGVRIVPAVAALRQALLAALPEHAPFPVGPIDVDVVGLIEPARGSGR